MLVLHLRAFSLLRNVTRDGRDAVGSTESRLPPPMHLAVVTCGERLEETLTMIKSGVLFSIKPLHLHIFAEDQLHASFVEAVRNIYIFVCCFCKNIAPVTSSKTHKWWHQSRRNYPKNEWGQNSLMGLKTIFQNPLTKPT